MTEEQIRIWRYYQSLAHEIGTEKIQRNNVTHTKTLAYSVECFFPEINDEFTPNAFVRAFLGDDEAAAGLPPLADGGNIDRIIEEAVCGNPRPYPAQLEGIKNALTSRVTLIQGPPGTGKTEMIVNLLSVIHRADPQATVAVLSPNNEALNNICEKIEDDGATSPEIAELKRCFSRLGNKGNRESWKENHSEDAAYFDTEGYIRPEYLEHRPIFTSTIHSLLKMFKNQGENVNDACFREYNMFDYIIIDECSQLSVLNGVAAMSRVKKSLVLVGDDEQLKPIIKQNVEADIPEIYKETEGQSFLGVCGKIFGGKTDAFAAKHAFLNEHYRCHPSIIGFCNEAVYNGALDIKTQSSGEFRIRAKWYEGSYCEYRYINKDSKEHLVKVNQKQLEIFIREELPRLRNTEQSIVVLCPYWYELDKLKEMLKTDEAVNDEGTGVFTLTIHKSQGKGYDVVYLLTVDDYWQKEPWSQKKELINVAVSRAKQEFCIITSAVWLPKEKQPEDLKNIKPDGEKADSEENMFYRELLSYVWRSTEKMSADEPGDYGFHKTEFISVFDKVPIFRERIKKENRKRELLGLEKRDTQKYAPELCMEQVLNDITERLNKTADTKLTVYHNALVADLFSESSEKAEYNEHRELFNYVNGTENDNYNARSHFDFVVCEKNGGGKEKVRLIIEVDGAYHRGSGKGLELMEDRDNKKNEWVINILQAEAIFLRFPTDGSRIDKAETEDETEDETILKTLGKTNPIEIWYEEGRHNRRRKQGH